MRITRSRLIGTGQPLCHDFPFMRSLSDAEMREELAEKSFAE
jgi:hypothetical protein